MRTHVIASDLGTANRAAHAGWRTSSSATAVGYRRKSISDHVENEKMPMLDAFNRLDTDHQVLAILSIMGLFTCVILLALLMFSCGRDLWMLWRR
jgi:hypothetical protein